MILALARRRIHAFRSPVYSALLLSFQCRTITSEPSPPSAVKRVRPTIRSAKSAIAIVRSFVWYSSIGTLTFFNEQTPHAAKRLRDLSEGPTPQLIRIGVRNKGCAGLSYHLDYVDQPGKFDEVVEQDGVKVLIDSKALFSIIGSEMDWQEDALRRVRSHTILLVWITNRIFFAVRSSYLIIRISRMLVGAVNHSPFHKVAYVWT